MSKPVRFIIIDDDPHNNILCKFVINNVAKEIEVLDFILPEEGFAYIASYYSQPGVSCPTIVLLDINMPVMNGWDFLERYDGLSDAVKQQLTIYILSSSVDWNDKKRATASKYIKNYVIKPLVKGTVHNILSGLL